GRSGAAIPSRTGCFPGGPGPGRLRNSRPTPACRSSGAPRPAARTAGSARSRSLRGIRASRKPGRPPPARTRPWARSRRRRPRRRRRWKKSCPRSLAVPRCVVRFARLVALAILLRNHLAHRARGAFATVAAAVLLLAMLLRFLVRMLAIILAVLRTHLAP